MQMKSTACGYCTTPFLRATLFDQSLSCFFVFQFLPQYGFVTVSAWLAQQKSTPATLPHS